jgi:AraC family transcriptional regulator of adaptative response / DNA-3-methyladenine glycosylase II
VTPPPGRPQPPAPAPLRWRLRLPTPYDLGWVLGFLADRAAPALERVDEAGLVRVVRVAGVPAVLDLRFGPDPAAPRRLTATAELAGPAAPAGAGSFAAPVAGPQTTPAKAPVASPQASPAVAPSQAGDTSYGSLQAGDRRTSRVDMRHSPEGSSYGSLRRLVRRMLDLDTDLGPFLAMARRDSLLAPLVACHPGLRLPQLPDPFEGAVRAIVGQQVSVAGARTVVDRLIRDLGEPLPGARGLFAFPHPDRLAAARPERITALGLTRVKAAALLALATACSDGTLDWERLRAAPPEAAQQALVAQPGIGPWTASYIRMRALGDRDAFPASDLGVVKALARHAAPTEISALAERWRPFRAYAAIHLWRSLSP